MDGLVDDTVTQLLNQLDFAAVKDVVTSGLRDLLARKKNAALSAADAALVEKAAGQLISRVTTDDVLKYDPKRTALLERIRTPNRGGIAMKKAAKKAPAEKTPKKQSARAVKRAAKPAPKKKH